MPPPLTVAGTSGRPLPVLPIILISALLLFGFDALLGQISRNGYMELLGSLLDNEEPRFLPGTDRLILRRYFGIPPIDRTFTQANIFFSNVFDGSSPAFSLFAFYFGSQLVAFFMIFVIERQRVAKWSNILFHPLIWGLSMQAVGYGIVSPIFFVLHLVVMSKNSLSDTVRLRDPTSLHTMMPAVMLGYVLFCGLAVYPFPRADMRQWFNAFWQIFPVHVIALQTFFTSMVKRTSLGQDAFTAKAQLDRNALSSAYGFAWNAAVTGQLCTFAVLITSAFMPGLYPAGVAQSLTPNNVFVPGPPHSTKPMVSPAVAMHDFFRYDFYVGSLVALIWAVHLLSQVRPVLTTAEERKTLGRGIVRSLLLSGPGGTLVALLQHRDETVLAAEIKALKSQ